VYLEERYVPFKQQGVMQEVDEGEGKTLFI